MEMQTISIEIPVKYLKIIDDIAVPAYVSRGFIITRALATVLFNRRPQTKFLDTDINMVNYIDKWFTCV